MRLLPMYASCDPFNVVFTSRIHNCSLYFAGFVEATSKLEQWFEGEPPTVKTPLKSALKKPKSSVKVRYISDSLKIPVSTSVTPCYAICKLETVYG